MAQEEHQEVIEVYDYEFTSAENCHGIIFSRL